MWWEPAGEREQLVRQDVERLSLWLKETRRDEKPVAWGVGSVWFSGIGDISPFIILNAAHWPRAGEPAWPSKLPLFPVGAWPDGPGARIPETRLPLLAVAAYRPTPASTSIARLKAFLADQIYVRDYVICQRTGDRGTAGVRVCDSAGKIGLLTAGHNFRDGFGSEVGRRRWPRLGRLSSVVDFGRIIRHVMPRNGQQDWDVAIIDVKDARLPKTRPASRLCGPSGVNRTVFAHGARSGFLSDAIVVQAALADYGDERYRWRNCWLVAPGGVLRPGDSGTAVFTVDDQALLGLYVGSARTANDRPAIHFVQDADSIAQQVLAPWGYNFC